MATYYTPTVAVENTIISYISRSVGAYLPTDMNYYTGLDNGDKIAPAVLVACHSAMETYFGTRVYAFDVDITIKDIAYDTTKINFDSASAEIISLFGDSKKMISGSNYLSTGSFYTYQSQIMNLGNNHDEDAWSTTLNIKLIGALI